MLKKKIMRLIYVVFLVFFVISSICFAQVKEPFGFNNNLVDAADKGDLAQIKQNLQSGINIDSRAEFGITALMRASFKGYENIVAYLLEKGADSEAVDLSGTTALHLAARNGNIEIIKMLLKYGAVIDEKDEKGYTSLMKAIIAGKLEAAKTLLFSGADPYIKNHDNNDSFMLAKKLNKMAIFSYMKDHFVKDFNYAQTSLKPINDEILDKENIIQSSAKEVVLVENDSHKICNNDNNIKKENLNNEDKIINLNPINTLEAQIHFEKNIETNEAKSGQNKLKDNLDEEIVTKQIFTNSQKEPYKPKFVIEEEIIISKPDTKLTSSVANNIQNLEIKNIRDKKTLYEAENISYLSNNSLKTKKVIVGYFNNLEAAENLRKLILSNNNMTYLNINIIMKDNQRNLEISNFKDEMSPVKLCEKLNQNKKWHCEIIGY